MNIQPLNSTIGVGVEAETHYRGPGFGRVLEQARLNGGYPDGDQFGPNGIGILRDTVQQFLATTLVSPLLKELRDEPFKSDLFHGGLTEDVFRQQLDTILADRITRSPRFGLVDHLYDSFSHSLKDPSKPPHPVDRSRRTGQVNVHG